MKNIIIDTNVLIAGLQSKRGQSYRLLQLLYENRFDISISVPLILEYEALLKSEAKR
ncbi:putative toxin-antitoxin system toxin component, PIN family, partial [Pseudobutyrivibrio sp.]